MAVVRCGRSDGIVVEILTFDSDDKGERNDNSKKIRVSYF